MISPEGERVGLTKVINIIISFFVNEKTLCCPFYNEIKGRFPKVGTGRFEILSCFNPAETFHFAFCHVCLHSRPP